MASSFSPSQADVVALAKAGVTLSDDLFQTTDAPALAQRFSRLAAESCLPEGLDDLHWQAQAEMHSGEAGELQPWLFVQASARLPLVCQRCLEPVVISLEAERAFRFVANEEVAAAEVDLCEEDVLVLEPRMDLLALVEDELLMSLPLLPMHEECPVHVPTTAVDEAFAEADAVKKNPFSALDALKKGQKP